MRKILILPAVLGASLVACDDAGSDPVADGGAAADAAADATVFSSINLAVEAPPTEAPAGSVVELVVQASLPDGAPAAGLVLEATVAQGGGRAEPATTGEDGRATLAWQLGPAPVAQRLRITVGPGAAEVQLDALAPEEAATAAPFGDVATWLGEREVAGSTEDLEFWGGGLVLGVPGGLIRLDPAGAIEEVPLTGDAVGAPLGLAADRAGNLWVADADANALLKIDPSGAVSTVLTEVDAMPLVGPNFVAIGPDDKVYLSDPCLGLLIRFDPAAGAVDATHAFDLATEGGPNGFAFQGDTLWVVTENTVLVCRQGGMAPIDAPLAGLFRMPTTAEGFGERSTVATGLGVFGDGLTFDGEGNLYVILDQVANLRLSESAVWVLPAGGQTLRKFLVAEGVLYANLAFGQGNFDSTTLFVSLLSVPPFAGPISRGVQSFVVGIAGKPLP